MADIALRTRIPDAGSIFDEGLAIPEDPIARGKLGVAALNGIEPDFEAAIRRATQKNTISDVYSLVVAQGIDALIDRLAASGVPRESARASLTKIEELVSKAASYPVMPVGASEQFYITEAGDILKSANEEPVSDPAEKIDRLHQFALALVSLPSDPIESLPAKTRERLLTALTALRNEVLTPRGEGQHEVKTSTPNLRIPDGGRWVSDTIDISASGHLQDFKLDIDLEHPYIGALTVELVAPDRTSVKLHDRTGEGTRNIKKTFTLDSEGMRALEGKEVNGRWRVRIIDHDGYEDNGTLKSWKLDIKTRGSTGSSERFGEAKKKALYAGAGAIGRRLASAGSEELKTRAFDFTADLVKTSPYGDVRTLLIAGLNNSRDKLTAADRARFDKELVPLVAPETPDYDTIFRLKYGPDGRYVAEKRSLNFVVMFGDEEDNLIYNGGKRMIERQGFTKVDSDKPGYELFVKKVNQDDPNAPCQEIRTYVAKMNGSNMMQAFGDEDIDVVVYDGHSNLGRNIENSLKNAPELAGSKIFVGGACATTDRAFMIRNKYQDTKRLQLINTYESTYFNWEVVDGRKYLNYSENLMLTFGLQKSMSQLKGWKGPGSIAEDLKRATDSWSHTKDINYTNPGMLEQLMLWDLDKNGLPDGSQQVWDGLREKVTEIVDHEFTPQRPSVPVNKLDGTKIFQAVHSLDTFGRYNPITLAAYQVRTIAPRGFQDLGENGPMVRVQRNPVTRGWEVIGNSWYSHASVEAFRFEMHHQFMDAVLRESRDSQVRRMSTADKNIMKLLFAGSSLVYDNSWRDDPIWRAGLKRHNYPDGINFHAISSVLHWEHDQPGDQLSGNWRDIPKVKEALGEELTRKLDDPNVGVA